MPQNREDPTLNPSTPVQTQRSHQDPQSCPQQQIQTPQAGRIKEEEEYREYAKFIAFFTAHYLECKAEYDPLSVFVSTKIDPIPYQIYDFERLMEEERRSGCIRALVAYETGLGKTILVGMLIKELLGMGERHAAYAAARRVLIVTPPSVLKQFKAEMEEKFGLEFHEFSPRPQPPEKDPVPAGADLVIASMDTLKRDRWRDWVESQRWDIVVVDEYHRVSPWNMRGELATLLSSRTKHFVALTATPHDGDTEKYQFRLDTIAKSPLIIRRLKREGVDVNGRPLFDHSLEELKEEPQPSAEELAFYETAEEYVRDRYRSQGSGLLATVVGRAVSSSIRAGLKLLARRRTRIIAGQLEEVPPEELEELQEAALEGGELSDAQIERILRMAAEPDELRRELEMLGPLVEAGRRLVEREKIDSKGKRLLEIVRGLSSSTACAPQDVADVSTNAGAAGAEGTGEKGADDDAVEQQRQGSVERKKKLLIFTSFRETVEYLKEALAEFEPLEITGSMDMSERKRVVDEFSSSPRRTVLIGTDAMGESLNLQAASVEVNYEVPWSPVAYIQRVGRIWRLKQEEKRLFVINFLPPFPVERRVMEVVLEKMRTISEEFGEIGFSVFGRELGSVEELVKEAYASGVSVAERRAERALEETRAKGREVAEILERSMQLPRVVNAEALEEIGALSLQEVLTEGDLKAYLRYLKEAGVGFGEFPGTYLVLDGDEYCRVDSLSLESEGMRRAIRAGKALYARTSSGAGTGGGSLAVAFSHPKNASARVCMVTVKVGGRPVYGEPALFVREEDGGGAGEGDRDSAGRGAPAADSEGKAGFEGVLTYRGVISLAPAFAGRGKENEVHLEPRLEYERRLKEAIFRREWTRWNEVRRRLLTESLMEEDQFRRELCRRRLGDWTAKEPREGAVEVEIAPLLPVETATAGAGAQGADVPKAPRVEFVRTSPEEAWRERWEVETIAIMEAERHYRSRGYDVEDISRQNRGYDLECRSAKGTLRVEVKGLRNWAFPELTQNERIMAAHHGASYVLFVVKDEGSGVRRVYEVPDPERNLELKEVLRPFYEVRGFERFEVIATSL